MEPYKKRRWRRASSPDALSFFTCARPGRSKGQDGKVPDATVDLWVRNLPGPHPAILSLLGQKPKPRDINEYSFYSFYGRESFQSWLDRRHPSASIEVIEHPTTDFNKIPPDVLGAVAADVERFLAEGRVVIVVDSGGETRTRQVCDFMGFVEDTRS